MHSFDWYFNAACGYLIFGAAMYAICGIGLLLRSRPFASNNLTREDLVHIYTCLIGLLLLEGAQVVWDSFSPKHFPLFISRLVLFYLFPSVGNSAFRLYQLRAEWQKEN